MTTSAFLGGFAVFLVISGCAVVVALLLVRRRLPELAGADRVVAFGLLTTTALIGFHMVPGVIAILTRGTVLATAVLGLAFIVMFVRPVAVATVTPSVTGFRPLQEDGRLSTVLAALGVLALTAFVALFVAQNDGAAISEIDSLTFHIPGVANWMQTESFWTISQFVPELAQGYYPNNGNVVQLAVVLPWHSDSFVRFSALPYVALTAAGVYALSREIGSAASTAVLVATFAAATPTLLSHAVSDANPDTTMYASFVSGVLFLVRHARTRAATDLVLAGVGLGLAFGTKWYGVSGVAVILMVWGACSFAARRSLSELAREAGVLIGLVSVLGGFWLLRNLVASGNPVFPVKIAPLGITIFDAPYDRIRDLVGFSIADYATDASVWKVHILPAFADSFGLGGLLLMLATAGVPMVVLGNRCAGARRQASALAAAVTLLALVYAVTPYTAQGLAGQPGNVGANTRYLVPALLLAGPLAAWCAARLPRVRRVIEALLFLAVLEALTRTFDLDRAKLIATVVVVAGVGIAALKTAQQWSGLAQRQRRLTVMGIGLVAVVALAFYGRHQQRDYETARQFAFEPVIARLTAPGDEGTRVGVAGVWDTRGLAPPLAAFGDGLKNHVEYVGDFRRGLMQQIYSKQPFLRRLRDSRLELVVLGLGVPPKPQIREEIWLRSAGWKNIARSDRLALYQRPGAVRDAS